MRLAGALGAAADRAGPVQGAALARPGRRRVGRRPRRAPDQLEPPRRRAPRWGSARGRAADAQDTIDPRPAQLARRCLEARDAAFSRVHRGRTPSSASLPGDVVTAGAHRRGAPDHDADGARRPPVRDVALHHRSASRRPPAGGLGGSDLGRRSRIASVGSTCVIPRWARSARGHGAATQPEQQVPICRSARSAGHSVVAMCPDRRARWRARCASSAGITVASKIGRGQLGDQLAGQGAHRLDRSPATRAVLPVRITCRAPALDAAAIRSSASCRGRSGGERVLQPGTPPSSAARRRAACPAAPVRGRSAEHVQALRICAS